MEEYVGFNGEALRLVRDTNIPAAKALLDRTLTLTNPRTVEMSRRTLGATVQPIIDRTRAALRNIFGILCNSSLQPEAEVDGLRLEMLRESLRKVRAGFDSPFRKVFQVRRNPILAAWVSNDFKDQTVNFTSRYFDELTELDQAVTLVHERAHTVLQIPGHPGTGDSPVCIVPHEGKKVGFDTARRNAYCYEWLVLSLHPAYNAQPYRDACAAPPR